MACHQINYGKMIPFNDDAFSFRNVKPSPFRSGSIILAFPLFIAGLFCILGALISITKLFESGLDPDLNISLVERLLGILIFFMVGLMSVIGAYRLITKKERIFHKWFIVVFSVLFSFAIVLVIATTKNFTLLGLIIGILIFNYQKFFKNRKKNQVINSNRYFR